MRCWLGLGCTLVLTACQCVQPPAVTYACVSDLDCTAEERCVERLCLSRGDGGQEDGGQEDGGRVDGGQVDGGQEDGGVEGDCGDGVDDDGDGRSDCSDEDCAGRPCRAKASACDAVEVCMAGVCPGDENEPAGSVCDDGTACTREDRCQEDGGCEGVKGPQLFRCTQPGVVEILSTSCPPAGLLCGPGAPEQEVLARELPNTAQQILVVNSPMTDGGCQQALPDGGSVSIADTCGDWVLDSAPRAGMCVTNQVQLAVDSAPFPGSVAVYQHLFVSKTPRHLFSLNRMGPPFSQLDPGTPLFYACPP